MSFERKIKSRDNKYDSKPMLQDGSKVAVIGGGPAGSFFSYFLLDMAQRVDMKIGVDVFEPRDFFTPGPKGCNMCGGIISESLVQMLAAEGIILPPGIIQRGIDSYMMHSETGAVRIDTPLNEKRIGAVHRGAGPKDSQGTNWGSFDGFLQVLTIEKGANLYQTKVDEIYWDDKLPQIKCSDGTIQNYDLLAVTVGVNTNNINLLKKLNIGYRPPRTTKTLIREYYLGEETVAKFFGNSMHVFLVNIRDIQFAALIPKIDYVTLCMLGKNIDEFTLKTFLSLSEVKKCFPPYFNFDSSCKCFPKMTISGSKESYANRIVFIGDSGVTRLYKDGIGAAYRTAKAAAMTCVFKGISAKKFKKHYWPACKKIHNDNRIGKFVFGITNQIKKRFFLRQVVTRMVIKEQQKASHQQYMSLVLWDMFTGSASYREIFILTLHPLFLFNFIWFSVISIFKQIIKRNNKGGL
jgi:flavin-dependent dehydrogenase